MLIKILKVNELNQIFETNLISTESECIDKGAMQFWTKN